MSNKKFTKNFVEKKIRAKSFGVLSTVSPLGRAQSSGVLYGVSDITEKCKLFILTGLDYKKTHNIMKNPHVSFTITFPHYYFRFAPASTIQFQALAKILSIDDQKAINSFKTKRILRDMLGWLDTKEDLKDHERMVFIELTPMGKYNCYGVGYSIIELAKKAHNATYQVGIT